MPGGKSRIPKGGNPKRVIQAEGETTHTESQKGGQQLYVFLENSQLMRCRHGKRGPRYEGKKGPTEEQGRRRTPLPNRRVCLTTGAKKPPHANFTKMGAQIATTPFPSR